MKGAGRRGRGALVALIDQGVVSLAHFAVGLSVARVGSPEALGLFGLTFVVLLSAGDVHRALVWLPMTQEAREAGYRSARGLGTRLGAAGGAVAVLVAAALAAAGDGGVALVAAVLSAAIVAMHLNEIQRRIHFARRMPARALMGDLAYAAGAAGVLVAVPYQVLPGPGVVVRALAALVVGAVSGAAVGSILLRDLPPRTESVLAELRRYWRSGRAYLMNAVMVFASQRVSLFVLTAVLGLEAMGGVEAARLITSPLMMMALGIAAVLVPDAAHLLADGGPRRVLRLARTVLLVSGGVAAAYVLVAVGSLDLVGAWVLEGSYPHLPFLIAAYGAVAVASLVATAMVAPLGALGDAMAVPRARLPGVVLVLVLSWPLALVVDERAVLGLVAVEGVLSALLLYRVLVRHANPG